MRWNKPIVILTLFLSWISFSCLSHKKNNLQQVFDRQEQYVSSGQLQLAIDGYNQALADYPNEARILDNYIRTVENTKDAAEKAYVARNYFHALKVYTILLDNFHYFQTFRNSLSFDQDFLSLKRKNCRIAINEIQVNNAIKSDNYVKAIGSYQLLFHDYHNDRSLNQSFSKTVSSIYQRGETAFKNDDLLASGRINYALLKNHDLIERSDLFFPFSNSSLQERLRVCRDNLTKKGLEYYRKGDLKKAISTWKGILEFDPENVEIKKAIKNSEDQLKKIKKESQI
ncbi:MAG: hypothetical protein JXB26_19475 [Candidatus Aminicenantes bacterium]|nr:hypothetical protein [Candidatus Aminicenantes bacterium]